MGAFFWGMLGGVIVLMAKRSKRMSSVAESAGKVDQGIIGRMKFCASELVEDFRDLVAESKMELEAEKAAQAEVDLHKQDQQ